MMKHRRQRIHLLDQLQKLVWSLGRFIRECGTDRNYGYLSDRLQERFRQLHALADVMSKDYESFLWQHLELQESRGRSVDRRRLPVAIREKMDDIRAAG